MKCERCGFDNPSGFAFCAKCGLPLSLVCPRCGFLNPQGLAFCGQCGAGLASEQARLTAADLDHLRAYLSPSRIEALQYSLQSPSQDLLEQCTADLARLLETTFSHLPGYLVEQVVRDPTPGQAGGHFVDGALLFADISGFTAMSERLSRTGREGAEEITAIINRYFDVMLSILREHGGQLIKFGGDALLGLFVEAGDATRAIQAALAMQQAMSSFAEIKTSQGVFPLQMKVGIHRGCFFAAQLGTPRGMEYILVGADVNATAAAESAAAAGQVLTDRSTLDAVRVPCQASPMPGDTSYWSVERIEPFIAARSIHPAASVLQPLASMAGPTLEDLRRAVRLLDALVPYLPAGLLARMVGAPSAASLEGENRLVAVIFANVQGLGQVADRLGPGREAQIVAALNRYFIAMDNAIQRFGGVINKMDLYDRGDKLLAFFGAPLAHEDDAERAVRAALAMQETLAEQSQSLLDDAGLPGVCLTQQIGLGYGYVFAGYVGTSWRREYTVMGDAVNLAARLMSVAAPGALVVSPHIRRKVQALFEMVPRGVVRLKGKSEPVPTFTVAGPRAIPEPVRGLKGITSPLVGRQVEWMRLQAALDQLLAGRGQIVSVMGEAGLGKSRLVAELRQHATVGQRGVQWVEGRCLSYTESISFWPFQEIVRQLVGLGPDDGETEALDRLRDTLQARLLPEHVSVTLPYLANFLKLTLQDALQAKVRYLNAEALQRQTFVAISALLEAQAKTSPLVLALEDIHWIDQASLALLEYLMPLVDRAPLMLLLLFRPERAKGCWQMRQKVEREFPHCAAEIGLHPLAPAESQELLTNLVRIASWPAEMRELILGRTEGNPLYMEEMLRALMDEQALVLDDGGQWQVAGQIAAFQVPDTLQGVIMTRLDRLDEPSRGTAQVASVVGRIFSFDVLDHIATERGPQLGRCLVGLQQHEIVRETQRAPELVYTFKHGMTQEVCYHSLLSRVRCLYHCKIAEYLCEAAGQRESKAWGGHDETESIYPLIAHHAFLGQDWLRALRYQLLAGQQARRLYANHEAIDHFDKALHSAENLPAGETLPERQLIHAALGELLTTTGQYDRALDHLQGALTLAVASADLDAQAGACRWLARLHELRGEYAAAFEWIEKGEAALAGRQTTEAAELSLMAGLIHTRQGLYDQALDECQNSLTIAQQLGEVAVLARAYNLLGHVTRLVGQSAIAIEHFAQAFDLYQGIGDISGQALVHNQIANASADLGQWQEAERHYCQAREIFDQVGDVYHRAMADNNLGEIALTHGRLEEALAFYGQALHSAEQIGGSAWMLGGLHNNLGHTLIRRGQADAALEHLRASLTYFEQIQARDFLPELHRHFAEAALLSGRLAEAEAQGQQALGLAHELSMPGEAGSSLRVLGQVAAAEGRPGEAARRLDESLSILTEVGDEYEAARTRLSWAQVCLAQGKHGQGLAALEHCIRVFERLEADLDLTVARSLREELRDATDGSRSQL